MLELIFIILIIIILLKVQMKIYWFFDSFSSKPKTYETIKNTNIVPQTENYVGLDQDKIDLLINKYNCEDQEDLALTLLEKKYEELTEDEKIFFNDPEWDALKSLAKLYYTINDEYERGRSLAIRELMNNQYNIQINEHGNPHKEFINFTLNYFMKYFSENPIDAELLLNDEFPTMSPFIKRHILNHQDITINESHLNEQISYNEFLLFCKKQFCLLYPEKIIRDEEIKNQFMLHSDFIRFIDDES